MSDTRFENWVSRVKTQHPKAKKEVLKFIYDFLNMQTPAKNPDDTTASDIIYNQFANGYCYYFAHMLQIAFKRGNICWAAPFGHIVWKDDNDVAYDISGCNDSECQYYIPIHMLGNMIKDFTHVPGEAYNASEQEIASVIVKWENVIHTKKNSDKPEDFDVIHSDKYEIMNWYLETENIQDNEIINAKRDYIQNENKYSELSEHLDEMTLPRFD